MENKVPQENILDEEADQLAFMESIKWYDYPFIGVLLIIAIPVVGVIAGIEFIKRKITGHGK